MNVCVTRREGGIGEREGREERETIGECLCDKKGGIGEREGRDLFHLL